MSKLPEIGTWECGACGNALATLGTMTCHETARYYYVWSPSLREPYDSWVYRGHEEKRGTPTVDGLLKTSYKNVPWKYSNEPLAPASPLFYDLRTRPHPRPAATFEPLKLTREHPSLAGCLKRGGVS